MPNPDRNRMFLSAAASRFRVDSGELVSLIGRIMRTILTLRELPKEHQAAFDQLSVQAGGQPALVDRLAECHPLLVNLAFCRFADQFLIYVSDLLTEVFTLRPQMIKMTDRVTVEFAMQFATRDEFLAALTEKQVIDLSFKGVAQLNAYLNERYSFPLSKTHNILSGL